MSRPLRLLDAFCGAGGCSEGYRRAGFTEIVGVDIAPQPRYPFRFVQGDALEFLASVKPGEYDLIHASPPCQAFTALRARTGKDYPDLLTPTRVLLERIGTPYVIENVPGAPLNNPVQLCGTMFDLRVYRHRRFESSALLGQPEHPAHTAKCGGHKSQRGRKAVYEAGGFVTITGDVGSYCGPAMGIDWMTGNELSQAIPPAYTHWIGQQLLAQGALQQ